MPMQYAAGHHGTSVENACIPCGSIMICHTCSVSVRLLLLLMSLITTFGHMSYLFCIRAPSVAWGVTHHSFWSNDTNVKE
jgi:hypothetical protein